jgi:hypothetical protein
MKKSSDVLVLLLTTFSVLAMSVVLYSDSSLANQNNEVELLGVTGGPVLLFLLFRAVFALIKIVFRNSAARRRQ